MSKYVVLSGPYFAAFGLNTEKQGKDYLSVFSPNAGKCGPEKTMYLEFHVRVVLSYSVLVIGNFRLKNSSVFRNSPSQMFFKIEVLENFANFTGKLLCWSHYCITLQALRLKNTSSGCFYVLKREEIGKSNLIFIQKLRQK